MCLLIISTVTNDLMRINRFGDHGHINVEDSKEYGIPILCALRAYVAGTSYTRYTMVGGRRYAFRQASKR